MKELKKKDFKNIYGRNVFVTGASSGIGEACARMFAENGCSVTGVSRNIEEGSRTYPGGGSLTTRRLDVTDEEAVRKVVEERGARCLGTYGCRGYNTYGPLKLVGGMNKSNPNEDELGAAVEFVRKVEETYEK